jgi:hypothetical protein
MQRLGLEDIVTLARSLASVPREDQAAYCLEMISTAHIHHKIAKRLGTRRARRYQLVPPAGPPGRVPPRDSVSEFCHEFECLFRVLNAWRQMQAQRGGVRNP